MEGIPQLTRVQTNTLIRLIELQKKKTGFTIRDLAYATKNKSTSTAHMNLGMLVKKGVAKANVIMPDSPEGKVLAARHSYKTDIGLVEHDGTVALFRMFE